MILTNTTNNSLNLIGICKKSQNLKFGSQLIESIQKQKSYLVILATDVAKNNEKKITDKCKFYNVRLIRNFTTEQLSQAIGKSNIVAVSIVDEKLAIKLEESLGV